MVEIFDKLRLLQDVLARKNELEQQIQELPRELKGTETLLERYKSDFLDKNKEHEQKRQELLKLTASLTEVELRRDASEKKMGQITTQRDYELVDKEIKDAEKEEGEIRKNIQRLTDEIKKLEDKLSNLESSFKDLEDTLSVKKASVDETTQKMTDEMRSIESEQKELSKGLDEDTLFKFERIIRNKAGRGIVAVRGNVCTGCHMMLSAEFANEVKNELEIKYCPYCSRVLFHDETASDLINEEEEIIFDDSDIGGLADLDEND